MKFRVGVGALLAVAGSCFLTRRPLVIAGRLLVTLCAVTIGFLSGWVAYGSGFHDIKRFLTTGWEGSQGYSSTMSWALYRWWIGGASFLIWFLLLIVWVLFQRGPRTLLSLAVLVLPLFVAWKHSMVRQHTHVTVLITFGIFVMFILLVDALSEWRWRSPPPGVGLPLIPPPLPWHSLPPAWRGMVSRRAERARKRQPSP